MILFLYEFRNVYIIHNKWEEMGMYKNVEAKKLNKDFKENCIKKLAAKLVDLRLRVGLSQEELGSILGISRQTYSSVETQRKKMTWTLFLSLILFFLNNKETYDILRDIKLLPSDIFGDYLDHNSLDEITSFVKIDSEVFAEKLDAKAIHTIETVIMLEYARCNDISGEEVIKTFNGKKFIKITDEDVKTKKAIKKIKASEK